MSITGRNIQTIIPQETHKVLREMAYEKDVPLRDFVRDILEEVADKFIQESQIKRALNVP